MEQGLIACIADLMAYRRRLGREAGMTPHQIMSITGHSTLKEVERYTRAASQKLMAETAMRNLQSRDEK